MPLMKQIAHRGFILLALFAFLVSCGASDGDGRFAFRLNLVGLPDSTTTFGHYEVWVVINNQAFRAGKFVVEGTGPTAMIKSPDGSVTFGPASNATFGPSSTLIGNGFPLITGASHLFITMEPEGDMDLIPSCQVILAGEVVGRSAVLTAAGVPVAAGFPCAQPDGAGGFFLGLGDFSNATGSFTMQTPTDNGTNPNNDFAGVWFFQPSALLLQEGVSSNIASLSLPELNSGLRYEAWAVVDGVERSLGTFTSPDGFDSDAMTALQRGDDAIGPPFPGGDFVVDYVPPFAMDPPALDLTSTNNIPEGDYRTFISIEPDIDNDPAPFQLRILDALIPTTAATNGLNTGNIDMNSLFMGLPTGVATMGANDVTLTALGLRELSAVAMSDRRGHFELWLDDGGAVLSAGRFLIEGSTVRALTTGTILGDTMSSTFDLASTGANPFPNPLNAQSCFITVENEGDVDNVPSERVILQGNVVAGVANMTVAGDVANGGRGLEDFSASAGVFHLSTPTDNVGNVPNDNMGIQFRQANITLDFDARGLTLPVLPAGWSYEGWVEDRSTLRVFSTGKFFDPLLPDSDHSTSASEGTGSKFALPGKGFLFDVGASMRLAAQMGSITQVYVTVESNPDNASGASALRILEWSSSLPLQEGTGLGSQIMMQNVFPDSAGFRVEMSYEIGD